MSATDPQNEHPSEDSIPTHGDSLLGPCGLRIELS
jgi:hypothetical protein